MARKNQNYLEMLNNSINRLKRIKEQDSCENEIFSKSIDSMIAELSEKEHDEVTKKFAKTTKKSPVKPPISESKVYSATQKGNDKHG